MQVLHSTAKISRIGNKILKFGGGVTIVILLLFGIYTIWYVTTVYGGSYSNDFEEYKPVVSDDSDSYDLAELKKINPDVIGWITIEGTGIDYPILQGRTNQEYLNIDLYGDFSLAGSIFLDAKNSPTFTDDYSIIYGHHMERGAMFGDVLKFFDEEYFSEHSSGYILLEDGKYEIEFVAMLEVDGYNTLALSPAINLADRPQLLEYVEENAVVKKSALTDGAGKLVSLVTCKNGNTNGRGLLVGRMTLGDGVSGSH